MRSRSRLFIGACGVVGLVLAAGPASTGSAAGASLVRASWADPAADVSSLPADPIEPDAIQLSSTNWAGWADVAKPNVALRYVAANFTVPTVTCGGTQQAAAFWVGLDGYANGTVEQAGVLVLCDVTTPSGIKPTYYSFWEMYASGPGHGAHIFTGVSPGDTIAVSVYYNGAADDYNLQLNDSDSTAPNINTTQPCPSGHTCENKSAEVIAEDPNSGPKHQAYLADFGTVKFTGAGVTSRNGTHGALQTNDLWTVYKITMAYQGTTMAKPSARANSGQDFSVTWHWSG